MRKVLLGCFLASLATATHAQSVFCAPKEIVTRALTVELGLTLAVTALDHQGRLVEIYTNASGDWAVQSTEASGISCLVSGGEGFEFILPVKGKPL